MIRKLAWNTFEKTGNIDVFLEYRKIKGLEEELKEKNNENFKSKWNSNSGK